METKRKAFINFKSKLVQLLPIDDVVFKCMLIVKNIFHEDELLTINSQPTPSESAAKLLYFLDAMIESEDFYVHLCNLLLVMEEYDATNDDMQKLAGEMRNELHMRKFVCMFVKYISSYSNNVMAKWLVQ